MINLLRKNLAAHKKKNFLTSLIYSLTLGCIIFLMVTASLQIQTINEKKTVGVGDLLINDDYIYPS